MVRLPIPGADDNTWGSLLNTFLEVSHNADGTLIGSAIQNAGGVISSQVGAANGVASLNGSSVVPATQLGTGTGSSTNFLRGDGTWAVPSGSTGALLAANNLSDVADAGSARANIHIPTLTPAACVATSNVSLSSFQTIDGYTLASGDLVLLTAQTATSQNGLWAAASGAWTRPTEFASGLNVKGRTCAVLNGTAYSATTWLLAAPTAGITVDTGSQTWNNQSASGGSYVAAPTSTTNEQGYAPLVLSPSGTTQWGMPWQFNVLGYGAKGNGACVTDGAMTSGSAVLTCATSTPFHSSDVGKAIMVKYAITDATGSTLVTTIASFQSSSQVTLSASATNTVSSATVLYGTDDTTAIQNAVNAAVTYAQAHAYYAEVVIPPSSGAFYAVAGALQTGGSTLGNAQITLPIIGPTVGKVTLVLLGGENAAAPRYWNQTTPAFNGPTLVSFGVFGSASAQVTSINNNGNPAMISGPTGKNNYGTSPALLYSNMLLVIKGLTLLTTHSADGFTYSALNLHGLACANLFDVSYGTIGVVLLTQGGGDFGAVSVFAAGLSIGILMPAAGNNDSNQVRNVICQGGYTFGFFATEHSDIHGMTILYCWSGLCLVGSYGDSGSADGAVHAIHATQISVEACSYHVNIIGTGTDQPTFHGTLDTEGVVEIRDNGTGSNAGAYLAGARGELRLTGSVSTVNLLSGTGGTGTMMRIITEWQAPGPVTTPTYTLSTAQINAFWRPATVYVSGGTNITSIQVSEYMGGTTAPTLTTIYTQAAGALPVMNFRLSPGQWWVINASSGTAPTMQWVLE